MCRRLLRLVSFHHTQEFALRAFEALILLEKGADLSVEVWVVAPTRKKRLVLLQLRGEFDPVRAADVAECLHDFG